MATVATSQAPALRALISRKAVLPAVGWSAPRRAGGVLVLFDSLTAVLGAGACVLIDLLVRGHPANAGVWDALLVLPLAARRARPAAAAAVLAAVCLAQWRFGSPEIGDFAVLAALYSLGAHERRRGVLLTGIAVAVLGVIMALSRWETSGNPLLVGATATGTVTAAWIAGIYTSMRRAYVESIHQRAQAAERDRDSRARIAVAQERTRLAREMHDVIAHSLSVMITLNDAAAAVEPSQLARDTIAQASDVGRQALGEMHRMLGVLRGEEDSAYEPQPGLGDLPALASLVRAAGFELELVTAGDLESLAPTAQLAIYRIVQESLTNVIKHARRVTKVLVEVSHHASLVDLRVENDGSPVAAPAATATGHGLHGMNERAALYGGEVRAAPLAAGGWCVRARLAVDHPAGPR